MADVEYINPADNRDKVFRQLNSNFEALAGGGTGGGGGLTDEELRATPVAVTGPATNAEMRATPLPVTVGGTVPVSGPLTNAQMRATPVNVTPTLSTSGNAVPLTMLAGETKAFAAQACSQATVANFSNAVAWVIQGGQKFPLFPMAYFSFFGITNMNQLSIEATEDGTIYAHWEAA